MGEYSEDEYISKTRANIRPWMNTFSKTWANFVRGRIVSRKRGANIRPWTNTFSKTWVEYSSVDDWSLENVGTISLSKTWGEYSSVDECYLFDGWFSRVFVKTIRIRAGCLANFSCFSCFSRKRKKEEKLEKTKKCSIRTVPTAQRAR